MLHINFYKGIKFIVAQLHIVGRLQLLNHLRFYEQGLKFGAQHNSFNIMHTLQKTIHFARIPQRVVVVRSQAIFETFSFAHIDNLTILVFHQVDAGFIGKIVPPGGIQQEASRGADGYRRRGEFAISAEMLHLFGERGLGNVATPGYRQL